MKSTVIRERQEMAKYLRYGDMLKIAEMAGVHRNTVEDFLKGKAVKSTVAPYVEEFVKRRKAEVTKKVSDGINDQEAA